MSTKAAIEVIAKHRAGSVVVCTMTTVSLLHEVSPGPLNLTCQPLMGGASGLGLGIALAQPERKVLVLDGDGSLLMQLGSLVTIADAKPANLCHFVFRNGVWFSGVGNLPIPGGTATDFIAFAQAAGYQRTAAFTDDAEFNESLPGILSDSGPTFVALAIEPETAPVWSAERPFDEHPDFHFVRMGEEARNLKQALSNSSSGIDIQR